MFSVHREFIGEDAGITWKTKDDKTDVSDLEETHNERKRKEKTRYLTLIKKKKKRYKSTNTVQFTADIALK